MAVQIKVSRQFMEDFEVVTTYYQMPPDEVEWLKKQARKNYEQVRKSLEEAAGIIRRLEPDVKAA